MENKPGVKIIKASTDLQKKVGTGVIDTAKVAMAQQMMESNTVDFGPVAQPFLDDLSQAVKNAKKDKDNPKALESLMLPIMNIKANATTFNYPVAGEVTGTVLTFLEHVGRVDDEILIIAENLHRAVNLVIAQKMVGGKNALGEKLIQEFKDVCRRYIEKRL